MNKNRWFSINKFKTIPMNLKRLSAVMSEEAVKKTVYNKLNSKLDNLEKKIPDAST